MFTFKLMFQHAIGTCGMSGIWRVDVFWILFVPRTGIESGGTVPRCLSST